ncbi:hypothetical protein F2Q69_00010126 [Brassica cretica]|uniref:Uncharacterized protein n=1 Tax=Brassica cretica TaxID=69181 RepID=A0A8S9PBL4_BRACR|nr:hypothetical protein F2Q69_00010126 [Brassica cretica]
MMQGFSNKYLDLQLAPTALAPTALAPSALAPTALAPSALAPTALAPTVGRQSSVSKIMAHSVSPSGDESPPTEAAPTAAAFADTKLERMAQQDVVQKATNEQLATIAAILAPLDGNSEDPATTVRK